MWQALANTARKLFRELNRSLLRGRGARPPTRQIAAAAPSYEPLRRVVLTDGVGRTLFDEYAAHRAEARGEEETGWLLLGLRENAEALVLATLPAGTRRDASVSHVRFNSNGQAMGSRIVRQLDRRLTILGVVHTHPGSLRHPSDGDFWGDSQWVGRLRGGEGVFGIGTADATADDRAVFAHQPRPNVQCLGELCFSWYALADGAANYRPLPVAVTLGPDLAQPLHRIWSVLEAHAGELDRLYRQQASVTFDVVAGEKPGLAVNVPLAEANQAVRVVVREGQVRYYLVADGELLGSDCTDERVDRGVYLLLAELAATL